MNGNLDLKNESKKELWLPIISYSIKKNISISTIRRHIKKGNVKYKMECGKYYIYDPALEQELNQKRLNENLKILEE